jgi:predicted nucleic acid-binding protein
LIGIDTSVLIAFEDKDHSEHSRIAQLIRRQLKRRERLVLSPQVLTEFVHVITDGGRFPKPLTMVQALARAEWWRAVRECRWLFPNDASIELFLEWMATHRLGRKRVLDTMLAATYASQGVSKIATLNVDDFLLFDRFDFVGT